VRILYIYIHQRARIYSDHFVGGLRNMTCKLLCVHGSHILYCQPKVKKCVRNINYNIMLLRSAEKRGSAHIIIYPIASISLSNVRGKTATLSASYRIL